MYDLASVFAMYQAAEASEPPDVQAIYVTSQRESISMYTRYDLFFSELFINGSLLWGLCISAKHTEVVSRHRFEDRAIFYFLEPLQKTDT